MSCAISSILNMTVNVKYKGNINCEIDGLNLCNRKTNYQSILSYVTSDKYLATVMENSAIKVLVVNENCNVYDEVILQRDGCIIYSSNSEMTFYGIHESLVKKGDFYKNFAFQTIIGHGCKIHSTAVIDDGVIIGNNVSIGAFTIVKKGTIIDDNVVIGCNSVIGSEGFQLITNGEYEPLHITHVGGVHLSLNVFVGDCVCIANNLFEGDNLIDQGAKIDNFVQIAHNSYIGKNAVITAHVVLCGSTRIEEGAWIAPNSSILNRVIVGKYAKIGLGSVVTRDIPDYSLAYGIPAKVRKKV